MTIQQVHEQIDRLSQLMSARGTFLDEVVADIRKRQAADQAELDALKYLSAGLRADEHARSQRRDTSGGYQ